MQETTFVNPFQINRSEHMGEDLYQYFAGKNLLSGLLSPKSLVLVGGRGSGKTMFFLYHSYKSKKREHYDSVACRSRILENTNIIGIYFKAEVDLVTGFQRKGQDEEFWQMVFGHYFNTRICRELCGIAHDLKISNLASFANEARICSTIALNFGQDGTKAESFEQLIDLLTIIEDQTLLYINNVDRMDKPLLSHSSVAMRRLADSLAQDNALLGLSFHVFVDEFENLTEAQQKLINSLIKNPDAHLVFDVGMKNRGFKTHQTLSENEQIGPDDYQQFDLEAEIDSRSYDKLIKEICRKRLRLLPQFADSTEDDRRLDIDQYLGHYDVDREVELIVSRRRTPPYVKEIQQQLSKIEQEAERTQLLEALTGDHDPIINRLNLVLLLRGHNPDSILVELNKFRKNESSKYKNWLHNCGFGVVFLLCRDYRQNKRYFGYDAFLPLSSGIVRRFLQLCYYSFDYAHRENGFEFDSGGELSIQVQDRAAYKVSLDEVNEIDTYPPVGAKLRRVTLLLGRVFELLHKRSTISEPEQNHFYTDYDGLSSDTKEVLDSGVMWAVFQPRPLTKIKMAHQPRASEYHLNHIYAPYFQISYRRKRRIDIKAKDFDALVNADQDSVVEAARSLTGETTIRSVGELIRSQDLQRLQLDLWDADESF